MNRRLAGGAIGVLLMSALGDCQSATNSRAPATARSLAEGRLPLDRVPVGAWSTYSLSVDGQQDQLTVSLVARDRGSNVVEYTLARTYAPGTLEVTTRNSTPPGKSIGDAPTASAVQVARFPPMEQPLDEVPPPLVGNDDATFVADEQVTTGAGTFAVAHYLQRRGDGARVDLWLSREVLPTGLVRLRERSTAGAESTTELLAAGGSAVPRITREPAHHDRDLLMRQMLASVRASAPNP